MCLGWILCKLGLHDWVRWTAKKYPTDRRECLRCRKKQALVYDFLSPYREDY
jgi:hypothetical protein